MRLVEPVNATSRVAGFNWDFRLFGRERTRKTLKINAPLQGQLSYHEQRQLLSILMYNIQFDL